MARDTQMSKVYAWERLAFPSFATKHPLKRYETQTLIYRVLADVKAAGGHTPTPIIKFTNRNGSARGSWFTLNFTPTRISLHLAIHEIAHALTWCPPIRVSAEVRAGLKQELTALERHLLDYGCNQGHGPKYVACYIALLERYADADVDALLDRARRFMMLGWGPWRVVGTVEKGGQTFRQKQRHKVVKPASVKVDRRALDYWRNLLKEVP